MERTCGSDQEWKRTSRVGLFRAGEERGICPALLLQRESLRYGSMPGVEQKKSITMDVRRQGVGCLVLHHLRGTRVLGASGFMGTDCRAGLARM